MSDGDLVSEPATIAIEVTPINDPPTAMDDVAETLEDTPVTVNVLANDSDIEGSPLTVVSVAGGTLGSAGVAGNQVIYTPSPKSGWPGRGSLHRQRR